MPPSHPQTPARAAIGGAVERTPGQVEADGHCERIALLAITTIDPSPADTAACAFAHRVISAAEDVLAQWAIVQITDGKVSGDHLAARLNDLRAVMDGAA